MRNFLRAFRLIYQYPATLAASVACSLLVAVLWGGNITALFPMVEITFQGRSLQQWVECEIEESETKSTELQARLCELRADAADPVSASGRAKQIVLLEQDLESENSALARYRWAQPYMQQYLPDDPFQTMVLIIALMLAATVLKTVFVLGSVMFTTRLVQRVTLQIRSQYFAHVLNTDLQTLNSHRTAKLSTICNQGVGGIGNGLRCLIGVGVREPLKIVVCAIGAACISWQLLLLTCILTPLSALATRKLAKILRREYQDELQDSVILNNHILQAFDGLQTVQAYNMQGASNDHFNRVCVERNRRSQRIAFLNALTKPVGELLGMSAVSVAILSGAFLVLNGETHLFGLRMFNRPPSVETMFLFFGLLLGISGPARKFSAIYNGLQRGCAAADRFYRILDRPAKILEPENPVSLPVPHRQVTVADVSFHYTPDQPVLRNVNLQIDFGETLAIIGPNGCGKSTLAQMIPRFLDPIEGNVFIDGVDLKNTGLAALRSRIGMVTQQTILFDESVLENIRFGSPEATTEQVVQAAKKARAHDFIEQSLSEAYQTVVGRNGCLLSGGQRQRIALARAILRDPEFLILDEATSEIDLQSELLIHEEIEEYLHGHTVIVVTHRPSALDLADRIVVMDAGQIVDVGTPCELGERCEYYRRLKTTPARAA
jgi:subfamily B ATP-binding cassette protein MsbA